MLKQTSILTAACLSVAAGLSLMGQGVANAQNQNMNQNPNQNMNRNNQNDNNQNMNRDQNNNQNRMGTNDNNKPLALPAGITAKNLNESDDIKDAFEDVAEDALDKTGFDNLVGCLVDQDRDRIQRSISSGTLNDINKSQNTKLHNVIASLQAAWKSKYNQDFNVNVDKAYGGNFFQIMTGEVADANQLVGKWPVSSSALSGNTGQVTQNDANMAKNKAFGGNVNLDKGRNVAVVRLETNQNLSGLTASMIHEAGGWKFDIPNDIDAQKLYDNVVNNLTTLERSQESWPGDVNEGYRRVTQAVVAALYSAPYPGEAVRPIGASAKP